MKYGVGCKFPTKMSGDLIITEVLEGDWRRVIFDDGYQKVTTTKCINDGEVRNPYAKTLFGVGWLGEGISTIENGKVLREYRLWHSMMQRCYYEHENISKSYKDKYVSPKWHCFQDFALWCRSQPTFYYKGWDLDKDLLKIGNKEYSPENCCFIPKTLNRTLVMYSADMGDSKGINMNTNGKWKVNYYREGTRHRSAKYFDTLNSAKDFYNLNRYNLLRVILQEEKENLDERVLTRLQEFL